MHMYPPWVNWHTTLHLAHTLACDSILNEQRYVAFYSKGTKHIDYNRLLEGITYVSKYNKRDVNEVES